MASARPLAYRPPGLVCPPNFERTTAALIVTLCDQKPNDLKSQKSCFLTFSLASGGNYFQENAPAKWRQETTNAPATAATPR